MDTRKEVAVGKDKVQVRLHVVSKTVLTGSIFLFHQEGSGIFLWKRTLDFFNEPARYFPFERDDDGRIVFIGRSGVLRATILAPEMNPESQSIYFGDEGEVRVTLSDGTTIEGSFYVDSPPPRRRTSDYLSKPEAFFHIKGEGGDEIVNKCHAHEVYPVEQE